MFSTSNYKNILRWATFVTFFDISISLHSSFVKLLILFKVDITVTDPPIHNYFIWIGLLRARFSEPYKTLIALMNSCCLCGAVLREAKIELEGGDLMTSALLSGAACEIAAVFFWDVTTDVEFFCSNCLYDDRDPKKRGMLGNFCLFFSKNGKNKDYFDVKLKISGGSVIVELVWL